MQKVKIKRVQKNKKKLTTKEKVLAGLGLGTTILGGAAGLGAQSQKQTRIVSTQKTNDTKSGSKAKGLLGKIFGSSTAYAEEHTDGETKTDDHGLWVWDSSLNDGQGDWSWQGEVGSPAYESYMAAQRQTDGQLPGPADRPGKSGATQDAAIQTTDTSTDSASRDANLLPRNTNPIGQPSGPGIDQTKGTGTADSTATDSASRDAGVSGRTNNFDPSSGLGVDKTKSAADSGTPDGTKTGDTAGRTNNFDPSQGLGVDKTTGDYSNQVVLTGAPTLDPSGHGISVANLHSSAGDSGISVDDSKVDYNTPGTYTVTINAYDLSGSYISQDYSVTVPVTAGDGAKGGTVGSRSNNFTPSDGTGVDQTKGSGPADSTVADNSRPDVSVGSRINNSGTRSGVASGATLDTTDSSAGTRTGESTGRTNNFDPSQGLGVDRTKVAPQLSGQPTLWIDSGGSVTGTDVSNVHVTDGQGRNLGLDSYISVDPVQPDANNPRLVHVTVYAHDADGNVIASQTFDLTVNARGAGGNDGLIPGPGSGGKGGGSTSTPTGDKTGDSSSRTTNFDPGSGPGVERTKGSAIGQAMIVGAPSLNETGDGISLSGVTFVDAHGTDFSQNISIDDSHVNYKVGGAYTVTLNAYDGDGNLTSQSYQITVPAQRQTDGTLPGPSDRKNGSKDGLTAVPGARQTDGTLPGPGSTGKDDNKGGLPTHTDATEPAVTGTEKEGDTKYINNIQYFYHNGEWTTMRGPMDSGPGGPLLDATVTKNADGTYTVTVNGKQIFADKTLTSLADINIQLEQQYGTRYANDATVFYSVTAAVDHYKANPTGTGTPGNGGLYTGNGASSNAALVTPDQSTYFDYWVQGWLKANPQASFVMKDPQHIQFLKGLWMGTTQMPPGYMMTVDDGNFISSVNNSYTAYTIALPQDQQYMLNYNNWLYSKGGVGTPPAKPAGFDDRHNADGSLKFAVPGAPTTPAASVTYSGGNKPNVGDAWQIIATGTPGQPVYAQVGGSTSLMGYIDGTGKLVLHGTFTADMLKGGDGQGNWAEKWFVGTDPRQNSGATPVSTVNFSVGNQTVKGGTVPATVSGGYTATIAPQAGGGFTVMLNDANKTAFTAASQEDLTAQMQRFSTADPNDQKIFAALNAAVDKVRSDGVYQSGIAQATITVTGTNAYTYTDPNGSINLAKGANGYTITIGNLTLTPDGKGGFTSGGKTYHFDASGNLVDADNLMVLTAGAVQRAQAAINMASSGGSYMEVGPDGVYHLVNKGGTVLGGGAALSVTNVNGNTIFGAGDRPVITVHAGKANANAPVYATGGMNGTSGGATFLGYTDANGDLQVITNPFGQDQTGNWAMNIVIGKSGDKENAKQLDIVQTDTSKMAKLGNTLSFTVGASPAAVAPHFIDASKLTSTLTFVDPVSGLVKTVVQNFNPDNYASAETAQYLAARYGGTAKLIPSDLTKLNRVPGVNNVISNDALQWWVIEFPGGQQVNAGLLAKYFTGMPDNVADANVRQALAQQGVTVKANGPITGGGSSTVVTGPTVNNTAVRMMFVNDTTGNTQTLRVGDHYTITITGPAGAYVYTWTEGIAGGAPTKYQIPPSGTLLITGTIQSSDVGTWHEHWSVNASDSFGTSTPIGDLNFIVVMAGADTGGGGTGTGDGGTINNGSGSGINTTVAAPVLSGLSYSAQAHALTVMGTGFNASATRNTVRVYLNNGSMMALFTQGLSGGQLTATLGQLPAGTYKVDVINLDNPTAPSNQLTLTISADGTTTGTGTGTGSGNQGGTGTQTNSYGTVSFANTNGSSTFKVGDTWKLQVSGAAANSAVYAIGGEKVGGAVPSDKVQIGTTDANGNLVLTKQLQTSDVGDWQITIMVGANTLGNPITFSVLPAGSTNGGGTSSQTNAPVLTGGTLATGNVGIRYVAQIAAQSGTGNGTVTYAVTSGSLPPGMTMNSNGLIDATPAGTGTYTFTVTATDSQGQTATASFTVTINAAYYNAANYGGGSGAGYFGYNPAYANYWNPGQVAGASTVQGLQMPPGYPASSGSNLIDLSYRYANVNGTIYDKTTGFAFSTPQQFFAASGVNSFTNVLFDTNWRPSGQVQGASVAAAGQTYTVKKGDTLWSIAKRYYGDGKQWRKIMAANSSKIKSTRTLKVGTQLVIPS